MRRREPPVLDLTERRSVSEIIATALRLYWHYPMLFLALGALVVVPYEVGVLAVTHAGPLGQGHTSAGTQLVLDLLILALIGPLVSALQLQALVMVGGGEHPSMLEIFRRALPVLPGVIAAEVISGIGIGIGFILLFIPGVYLAIRWSVVAQTAAFEQTQWPTTLRRSIEMTRGNFLRVLGLLILVAVLNLLVAGIIGSLVGTGSKPVQDVVGIALIVVTQSFTALTLAVLYFDLRSREPGS